MPKNYVKLILILLIPLVLIAIYGMSNYSFPNDDIRLEKVNFSELERLIDSNVKRSDTVASIDTMHTDSIVVAEEIQVDTTHQRILLFGDSMTEFLGQRMADYAAQNGYEFTLVCWYSSNTKLWAESDTLCHFLRKVKPTLVMVTIGGNEQFTRDLAQCERNIRRILDMVGDIPYIWICTPAWKHDTGINDLAKRLAGDHRFYDSRKLTLKRGSDHAHPTRSEGYRWMDSLATWMESRETAHPIRMTFPEKGVKRTYRSYILQPV